MRADAREAQHPVAVTQHERNDRQCVVVCDRRARLAGHRLVREFGQLRITGAGGLLDELGGEGGVLLVAVLDAIGEGAG